MLTTDERSLVRRVFTAGPALLFEEGYESEQAKSFLERSDVQEELSILGKELDHRDALDARARFSGKRYLARLVPAAAVVVGRAIAGPAYVRDKLGRPLADAKGRLIVQEPEPTAGQLHGAEMVLDAFGIGGNRQDHAGDVSISLNLSAKQATVTLEEDPSYVSEEQRSLSRERIRTALELLMTKAVPEAQQKLRAQLSAPQPRRRTEKLRARAKASAAAVAIATAG